MAILIAIIGYILMVIVSIAFPLAISAIAIGLFDCIFGTAYFTPPIVGGLAVILYAIGALKHD